MLQRPDDYTLLDPYPATHQSNLDWIFITLRGFEDLESGIHAYFVSVAGIDGWLLAAEKRYAAPDLIQFPVQLKHLQPFKVTVRAVNFAGVETTDTSEPIVVDAMRGESKHVELVSGPAV